MLTLLANAEEAGRSIDSLLTHQFVTRTAAPVRCATDVVLYTTAVR
jgi:hypothetical protein